MDDADLLRYSRHLMLPQIDIEGQQRLLDGRVLIAGLGGLGSAVATYLACSGVGHLRLADHDVVELSNLQRQILHDCDSIGQRKTESAVRRLGALNPTVELQAIDAHLGGEALHRAVAGVDVIVDCTDNFAARFALNQASREQRIPLVSGAAIRFEAQISTYDPRQETSPCYRCLYGESGIEDETCTRNGVLAPLLGVIGSLQATETLKLLAGFGEPLIGRLLIFDAMSTEWRTIKLRRDPQCPVCGQP